VPNFLDSGVTVLYVPSLLDSGVTCRVLGLRVESFGSSHVTPGRGTRRVQGVGVGVHGFTVNLVRVSVSGFRVLGFGFRVSGFGFRVHGFRLNLVSFGVRFSAFWCRVYLIVAGGVEWSRGQGSRVRVQGLGSRVET